MRELDATSKSVDPAVRAINALGIDLLAKGFRPAANALLSPYSIQAALAMIWAGADGETHAEMERVLHYPGDDARLHDAMVALRTALETVTAATTKEAGTSSRWGSPSDPITLNLANRLFGQQGYEFRESFLALLQDRYLAPLHLMDFVGKAPSARDEINAWVAEQTLQRIPELIPPEGLDGETRLVLVNAIHLKAPWQDEFVATATKPLPFHVSGATTPDVSTMKRRDDLGYAARDGFRVVTLPYRGGEVQFLILLPDAVDGLSALEAQLTPEMLVAAANPGPTDVVIFLPKFRLEPPMLPLGQALRALGMKSAFDEPRGSANFDRMAPRKPADYLFITEVFHQTFLALDEQGTEAAAATALMGAPGCAVIKTQVEPIEVRVDRPFLFAIQHRRSGACLFLGRVTDPR